MVDKSKERHPVYANTQLKLDEDEWGEALKIAREVSNQKWLYSGRAKTDIGTPQTVRNMLLAAYGFWPANDHCPTNEGLKERLRIFCRKVGDDAKEDYAKEKVVELLSLVSLMGEHNINRPPQMHEIGFGYEIGLSLEGELQRHWARKHVINNWEQVTVTPAVVADYCKANGLENLVGYFNSHIASIRGFQAARKASEEYLRQVNHA